MGEIGKQTFPTNEIGPLPAAMYPDVLIRKEGFKAEGSSLPMTVIRDSTAVSTYLGKRNSGIDSGFVGGYTITYDE